MEREDEQQTRANGGGRSIELSELMAFHHIPEDRHNTTQHAMQHNTQHNETQHNTTQQQPQIKASLALSLSLARSLVPPLNQLLVRVYVDCREMRSRMAGWGRSYQYRPASGCSGVPSNMKVVAPNEVNDKHSRGARERERKSRSPVRGAQASRRQRKQAGREEYTDRRTERRRGRQRGREQGRSAHRSREARRQHSCGR